jgi:hypothetical protein
VGSSWPWSYGIVFNATFNNISVTSWWSVLLMEETGGLGESHRPVASHWQTLSYNVVHLSLIKIRTQQCLELSLFSDPCKWLRTPILSLIYYSVYMYSEILIPPTKSTIIGIPWIIMNSQYYQMIGIHVNKTYPQNFF